MANEQLGAQTGGAVGRILGQLFSQRFAAGKREEQNKQAAEVLADIRASEGLETPERDARILAAQTRAPQGPEPTGFQGALSTAGDAISSGLRGLDPANLGVGSVSSLRTARTATEGLSELARIFGGVDTPGFKEYAAQIGEIQNESAFNQAAPILGRAMGLTTDEMNDLGPKGVEALVGIMKALPKEARASTQVIDMPLQQKDGSFLIQKVLIDKGGGQILAVLGDAIKPRTGLTYTFTDKDGNQFTIGAPGSAERTAKQTAARLGEQRKETLSKQRVALGSMIAGLSIVNELISKGDEPLATLGKFVGLMRSAGFQAIGGLNIIAGFDSLEGFLRGFDSLKMAATAETSAEMRVMELSLAVLRVRVQDPTGTEIGTREINVALAANAPIFSGDRGAIRKATTRLLNFMVDNFNREATEIGGDLFDMQTVSPAARILLNRTETITEEVVKDGLASGRFITWGELRKLDNALTSKGKRRGTP